MNSFSAWYDCRIWIAHVDTPTVDNLKFHLNIPSGAKIPRPGDRVFASNDNGRHGTYRIISNVTGLTRFHTNRLTRPFVSVDYVSL